MSWVISRLELCGYVDTHGGPTALLDDVGVYSGASPRYKDGPLIVRGYGMTVSGARVAEIGCASVLGIGSADASTDAFLGWAMVCAYCAEGWTEVADPTSALSRAAVFDATAVMLCGEALALAVPGGVSHVVSLVLLAGSVAEFVYSVDSTVPLCET